MQEVHIEVQIELSLSAWQSTALVLRARQACRIAVTWQPRSVSSPPAGTCAVRSQRASEDRPLTGSGVTPSLADQKRMKLALASRISAFPSRSTRPWGARPTPECPEESSRPPSRRAHPCTGPRSSRSPWPSLPPPARRGQRNCRGAEPRATGSETALAGIAMRFKVRLVGPRAVHARERRCMRQG